VAYVNHDIDDAIRARIIDECDLPPSTIIVLGNSYSQRINTMVSDIIEKSWERPTITMSPRILVATDTLRQFLFQRVYNWHSAQKESDKAREVVRRLYDYFKKNQDKLPPEYLLHGDEVEQGVVDYIAGMTDQFALRSAEKLSLIPEKGR